MGYVNKTYLSTQFKNFADKIAKVFSKIGHTHLKSDITDFPTSMPANGGNAATVGGHTVGVNVPSNAKFTDTTYSKLSEFTDDVGYVKNTDARLTNARPASDVYAWAKASSKPSYTKAEVGLGNVDNTADANKSVKYATSSGSASSALKATGVVDYGSPVNTIQIGYGGAGISGDAIKYIAGYTAGNGSDVDAKIKDVSKDALKSWLGLGSAAYINSEAFATASHIHSNYISNFGNNPTCGNGTAITQPGGNAAISIRTTDGTSRDAGILYLSEDNAYIANSSDNGYTFGVFDTDLTQDMSDVNAASFVVLSNGTGAKIRGQEIIHSGNIGSQSVNYATSAGNSDTVDGHHFNWSGQGGQPTWVWGGNDSSNMYVYNPSNFSVNYANGAGTMTGSYTGNGGQQNPNYFGVNKVGFLMMNTTVNGDEHYKDWIIMDCYSGGDVGGATAIGVDRQEMRAFIMGSDANRASWSRSAELITTANIGSQSVNYANSAGSAPASDVYAWAKASTKPSYTASEVGAISTSENTTLNATIILGKNDEYGIYPNTNNYCQLGRSNLKFWKMYATNGYFDKINDGTPITSSNISSQSVNYANTAGSAPASDVYAWAKASTPDGLFEGNTYTGNIDSYTESTLRPGKSYYISTTNISSSSALPFSGYGILTSYAVGSAIVQQIFRYNGSSKIIDAIYTRMYINSGWTSWSRVALTKV